MQKPYFKLSIIGAFFVGMVFAYSLNSLTYREANAEERQYKSDRTLIKEVLANQKQTHALLKDIKSSI